MRAATECVYVTGRGNGAIQTGWFAGAGAIGRSAGRSAGDGAHSVPVPLPRHIAAQQEFAADLHHRDPVIFDNVRRGVGLVPEIRDEAAGAYDVDWRLGVRHHPTL